MPPSDRRRDRQVNSGTFSRLEAAVTDLKRQRETTIELVKRLSPPQAENAKVPFRSVQSPIPAPSTLFAHSALSASSFVPVQRFALSASTSRPAPYSDNSEDFDNPTLPAGQEELLLPPRLDFDFDGNRSTGQHFYNSCRSYIRSHSEVFEDDPTKIRFVMSHMVAGRADRWANRELGVERDGTLRFTTWSDFATEFRLFFMHFGVEDNAVDAIETDSYFQGNEETTPEYLERFRNLIDDSGYTDPKYVVTKFRRGLNPRVSAALPTYTQPSLRDPEAWFSLAVQTEQKPTAEEPLQTSEIETILVSIRASPFVPALLEEFAEPPSGPSSLLDEVVEKSTLSSYGNNTPVEDHEEKISKRSDVSTNPEAYAPVPPLPLAHPVYLDVGVTSLSICATPFVPTLQEFIGCHAENLETSTGPEVSKDSDALSSSTAQSPSETDPPDDHIADGSLPTLMDEIVPVSIHGTPFVPALLQEFREPAWNHSDSLKDSQSTSDCSTSYEVCITPPATDSDTSIVVPNVATQAPTSEVFRPIPVSICGTPFTPDLLKEFMNVTSSSRDVLEKCSDYATETLTSTEVATANETTTDYPSDLRNSRSLPRETPCQHIPIFAIPRNSTPEDETKPSPGIHRDHGSVDDDIENARTRYDLDLDRGERTSKGNPVFDVTSETLRDPYHDQLEVPSYIPKKDAGTSQNLIPRSQGNLRQPRWARRLRPKKPGTT